MLAQEVSRYHRYHELLGALPRLGRPTAGATSPMSAHVVDVNSLTATVAEKLAREQHLQHLEARLLMRSCWTDISGASVLLAAASAQGREPLDDLVVTKPLVGEDAADDGAGPADAAPAVHVHPA